MAKNRGPFFMEVIREARIEFLVTNLQNPKIELEKFIKSAWQRQWW